MSSYEIFGRAIHEDIIPVRRGEGSPKLRRLAVVAAYEAALAVASEVHIDTVLRRIVEMARSVVQARMAMLSQVDADGQPGATVCACEAQDEVVCAMNAQPLADLLAHLDPVQLPTVIPDIETDPEFGHLSETAWRARSAILVPIRSGDHLIGNLFLTGREDGTAFSNEDLAAIMLLAEHAAASIDRARLYGAAEKENRLATEQLLQLRSVLDNLPAGVLVLQQPNAWIQMANNTAIDMIFGVDAERSSIPIIFRDFDWLNADGLDMPRSAHPGQSALRGERVENRQLTLLTSKGEAIPVLVQSAPVMNPENEVVGAVVVFQDVSRLRAAEQIKDDFLSLISHEFRTPLTAIHGGALLLQQQGNALDDETRKELLEDIGTESRRLDRMLGNLLSVAEIMAGRFQQSTEPILVEPIIRDLIDDFRSRSPDHTFTWRAEAGLPLAEGDPEWMHQIMHNLYENAVKYSPGGCEIRTTARREGDWVRIDVEDDGLGILPEHVSHVFERFRRPGADPTVRGMGLGLYLSRLLVDAMGGRISAASDGPGTGSTFTLDLPVVKEWDGSTHSEGEPDA